MVIIMTIYLSIFTFFLFTIPEQTYIVEMLGCFHDVWSSLVLVVLHPALTKELPVEKKYFLRKSTMKNIHCVYFPSPSHSAFIIFIVQTKCLCLCVCTCTHSYGMTLKTRWSSSVSCSAISRAEWLSNGSVLQSSMA